MTSKLTAILAAATAALMAHGVAQAQAPATLPMQGFLADGMGTPIDGDVQLTITLYDSAARTTALYTESQTVPVSQGSFTAYVGELGAPPLDLALFRDNSAVWVGIQIESATELEPFRLGSVPYAAWADHAKEAATVGGVGLTDLQTVVSGSCMPGQAIRAIAPNGTVTCEPTGGAGAVASVAAGTGLRNTGSATAVVLQVDSATVQTRVSGGCTGGQAISAISATGGVTCVPSGTGDITGVLPGSGLTGGGLSGSVTLAIATGAVTATHLATNSVNALEITSNAVGSSEIATNAVGSLEIAANAVGMSELSVPIGSSSPFTAVLAAGDNYIMSTTTVVPPASGTCLVVTNVYVSVLSSSRSRAFCRTARQDGTAAPTRDTASGAYTIGVGSTTSTGCHANDTWTVTSGRSYRFGCFLGSVAGDFVGRSAWCRVSWICG